MADAATFNVTIVTPDGTVFDDTSTMLVVTTDDGELGFMANHLPMIAALAIGRLTLKHADSQADDTEVAVNGGYVRFDGKKATVVADSAELREQIDVSRAQNAKSRAEKTIAHAKEIHDPDELSRGQVHLARALNRLRVSGNLK